MVVKRQSLPSVRLETKGEPYNKQKKNQMIINSIFKNEEQGAVSIFSFNLWKLY